MPFIILDRDGVINHDSHDYIKSPAEWQPIEGSLDAIATFNQAGYRVIIATNQSGIARGLYTLAVLEKIHAKMYTLLEKAGGKIEEIFFCPHHPKDHCSCRKPQPGLLQQIQQKYHLDLAETYFIGDSIADVSAARLAGCRPALVLTGNGQKTLDRFPELLTIPHFKNLAEAATVICQQQPGAS